MIQPASAAPSGQEQKRAAKRAGELCLWEETTA
jgi:hypothetical protein